MSLRRNKGRYERAKHHSSSNSRSTSAARGRDTRGSCRKTSTSRKLTATTYMQNRRKYRRTRNRRVAYSVALSQVEKGQSICVHSNHLQTCGYRSDSFTSISYLPAIRASSMRFSARRTLS
ncbi:hypothetical protein D9611_003485 [Ephemerocybe angulata]|uniref:Uncharacterized protein n=1 Tax=Ephemerocybe angulata TaxID=980116 RepID=A0A8H5B6H9_9AGAR|nr:hypothetical protein D9611_003485 [Tulosesus angulatus]